MQSSSQVQIWSQRPLLMLQHLNAHPGSGRANIDMAVQLAQLGDVEGAHQYSRKAHEMSASNAGTRERYGDYQVRNLALNCTANKAPTQEQIDLGTIPGAIHCPRGMMEFWASPASPYFRDYFEEDRRTVVFCAGGGRSVLAVLALEDMGFTNVTNIGGIGDWKNAGGPMEDG